MNVKKPGAQLDLIFWFVSRGFSVIPCYLGSKIPKIKWGKYQRQLPTEGELLSWFRIPSNAAVVTGTNNLTVIDFDDVNEYLTWSLWAMTDGSPAAHQIFFDSYKVRTARGIHLYTRCTNDVKNLHFGKIDVKGRGGLVTLPGSIHPSGAIYTEYQTGDFPIWSELSEIFPAETLQLMERIEPARRMIVDRDVTEYSAAQVLDMEVGVNIDDVKRAHKIEDYINDITFTGDHWGVAKCPFHGEDSHPSMWIDTKRQLCGCFTCTSTPMDVINLYSRLHNLSNSDAIREMGAK